MNPWDGAMLCAVAAVLIALATMKRRDVHSLTLSLFRVLLPSWRFFETIEPAPRLLCRYARAGEPLGAWQPLLNREPRSGSALLLNARDNLRLAFHSVLEQLQNELETLEDGQDPAHLVPYRLVQRIVLHELAQSPAAREAQQYQFCLAESEEEASAETREVLLVSEIHERGV